MGIHEQARLLKRMGKLAAAAAPDDLSAVVFELYRKHYSPMTSTERVQRFRSKNGNAVVSEPETPDVTQSETPRVTSGETPRVSLHVLASSKASSSGGSNGSKHLRPFRKDAEQLLDFLNALAGRSYRKVDTTLKPIEARLGSGVTIQNCKGVIARKVREWKTDPKMSKYLRPSTLFGEEKFEQYLGEREPDGVSNGS